MKLSRKYVFNRKLYPDAIDTIVTVFLVTVFLNDDIIILYFSDYLCDIVNY